MALLVLILGIALSTVSSTIAGAFALKALGIGVLRVDLGVWGPRVRFAASGCEFSVSPWMLSGSSTFKDIGNADLHGDRPGKLFSSFGRAARALLALAGPIAMLAIACLLTGKEGFLAFGSGFTQVWAGALRPLSDAQAYLSSFEILARQSPIAALGIVMAKLAAFNLLPVPPLNGGQALMELGRPRGSEHGRIATVVQRIGVMVVLLIAAMWLVAVCRWILSFSAI